MIEINLTPLALRKKKKSQVLLKGLNIPWEAVIGLGGGLVVFLILIHTILLCVNIQQIARHKGLEKKWDALLPSKENVDGVVNELRVLQGKQKAAEGVLFEDKVRWSQTLNALSESLPPGVWIKRISLEEGLFSVEGSAVATEVEGMINVHKFTARLKKEKKFLDDFTDLELGSIQRRKIKHTDLADFVITMRLK
jgi:Tfp pilus assembly protein PilN